MVSCSVTACMLHTSARCSSTIDLICFSFAKLQHGMFIGNDIRNKSMLEPVVAMVPLREQLPTLHET